MLLEMWVGRKQLVRVHGQVGRRTHRVVVTGEQYRFILSDPRHPGFTELLYPLHVVRCVRTRETGSRYPCADCLDELLEFSDVLCEVNRALAEQPIAAEEVRFIADLKRNKTVSHLLGHHRGLIGRTLRTSGAEVQPIDQAPVCGVEEAPKIANRGGRDRSVSLRSDGRIGQLPLPVSFASFYSRSLFRSRKVAIVTMPARQIAQITAETKNTPRREPPKGSN